MFGWGTVRTLAARQNVKKEKDGSCFRESAIDIVVEGWVNGRDNVDL